MKRLALLLTLPLLGGCIFATPPTGLRLGDHSQEFAHLQTSQPTATQVELLVYQVDDFRLIYPKHWSLGKADTKLTDKITSRITAGQASPTGESEGVTVITIDNPLDPDPAKATEALATFVKASLAKSYPTDFQVLSETTAKLGTEDGIYIEAKGADQAGIVYHVLSQAAMHEGKGYIVTISTIDRVFDTFRPLYDHVLKNFAFQGGAAPDATASGEATATGEAKASPEATATQAQQ